MSSTNGPPPELQDILLARGDVPPYHLVSVDSARQLRRERHVSPDQADSVSRVRMFGIEHPDHDNGIPIRVYEPETVSPNPTLVYFHGGGWVVGSLDSHDHLCRALANSLEVAIVSVDYRLAPEHPFPAALTDCVTATQWVATHGESIGLETDRLAVGGDSAGGNLAAAVALHARDEDGPRLSYQLLVYPVTDQLNAYPSFEENARWGLTGDTMEWFSEKYCARSVDSHHPYASPIRARSLDSLPPAIVLTCELDTLRDEGISYATRLENAGVETIHQNFDGMTHGFIGMLNDPELQQARDAVRYVASAIDDTVDS